MEKVFKNKKFTYIIIGILLALQLTQSIANWVGGGFNGGSLILCILMLGLLTLVGVGISKKNKLLTIVSGTSILSVVIYILTSEYSGLIAKAMDGKMPGTFIAAGTMFSISALLLIGSFIFLILKSFKVNKSLKSINNVFCLLAVLLALVGFIFTIVIKITNPIFETWDSVFALSRDLMVVFYPLLILCVWHQLEVKE